MEAAVSVPWAPTWPGQDSPVVTAFSVLRGCSSGQGLGGHKGGSVPGWGLSSRNGVPAGERIQRTNGSTITTAGRWGQRGPGAHVEALPPSPGPQAFCQAAWGWTQDPGGQSLQTKVFKGAGGRAEARVDTAGRGTAGGAGRPQVSGPPLPGCTQERSCPLAAVCMLASLVPPLQGASWLSWRLDPEILWSRGVSGHTWELACLAEGFSWRKWDPLAGRGRTPGRPAREVLAGTELQPG